MGHQPPHVEIAIEPARVEDGLQRLARQRELWARRSRDSHKAKTKKSELCSSLGDRAVRHYAHPMVVKTKTCHTHTHDDWDCSG